MLLLECTALSLGFAAPLERRLEKGPLLKLLLDGPYSSTLLPGWSSVKGLPDGPALLPGGYLVGIGAALRSKMQAIAASSSHKINTSMDLK